MIIGFDLDDVLLDFSELLCAHVNSVHGTKYEKKLMTEYELEKVWDCTREEAMKMIEDFFLSESHKNASTVPGAVEGIKKLKTGNTLHIVTAKPESLREPTIKWLDENFPGMFDEVHFTSHFQGEGKKRSKGEVCKELGIQVFVDDNLEHAKSIASVGIPVLLLDEPWNRVEIDPTIKRVYSWKEIVEGIQKLK